MARPFDVAVVGGGIVGLATAYQLLRRRPGLRLAVVEKEAGLALHQTARNSGVLHAGLYYAPGSLKARLCREGKDTLERFAAERGIPVERCGKLVVATRADELPGLARVRERAVANGVAGLREIGPDEMRELEPNVVGLRALHSAESAIVDFRRVALALGDELRAGDGEILLRRRVVAIASRDDLVTLVTTDGDVAARALIACAGLHSDRVAALTGDAGAERIVPFRGDYYALVPQARALVRALVYPVPDPSFPFLGIHLTKRIDGEVWVGPNAVLAFAREGYRRTDLDVRDLVATLAFPGFWRLALRHWRVGLAEAWRDLSKRAFLRELQRFVPALRAEDLQPAPAGVRAQSLRADGALVDDFSLAESRRVLHVRNAPSPGATASFAIGRLLAERAIRNFALS